MAVEQICKFLEGNKKGLLLAIIFMIISNCCYQGTVGLFVAILLIYIIKYSKNVKDFLKNNIIVALCYGIPAIINFLILKVILTNSRVSGNIILSESITKIAQGMKLLLFNTYGLLPKYFFVAVISILLVFISYKSITQKCNLKEKILFILGGVYITIGSLVVTVAPQILQDTNSIWFVARSSYPMASILGILLLYIFMNFNIKKSEKYIIIMMSVIFLIIQFISFMRYSIDNYIGNYIDKTITLNINSLIEEYEESTGETIDSISIYRDSAMQYAYPGLKSSGDINIKAYSADWCIPGILKLYTNKDFKVVENRQDLKEKFSQKNWDYFDKEQVVFEHNIMHICIF